MSFRDDYLAESAQVLARSFNPAALAHIAVDLQKGYCLPPLPVHRLGPVSIRFYEAAARTMKDIAGISRAFEQAGAQNIWVRHDQKFEADYFRGAVGGSCDRHTYRKLREFAAQGHEMCFDIPNGKMVSKKRLSAFDGTSLGEDLRAGNVSSLLITGGYRGECVAYTAVDAVRQGFDTFIIDDFVISGVPEETPRYLEGFCENCAVENIRLVTAAQVMDVMAQARRP